MNVGYAPQNIFSWGAAYSSEYQRAYISFSTLANKTADLWGFREFNHMQCRIDFEARNFGVLVNYTSKTISATPKDAIPWPFYANPVGSRIVDWLWAFSYTDTSFGGSYLGRSLRVNVDKLQSSIGNANNATALQGLADFLTSCVDNILVSLASAQLVGLNETTHVEATVGLSSARLGDRKFIYGVLALNMVICDVYCFEAPRTRFWRDAPALDIMDLTSVAVAALKGGVAVAGGTDEAFNDYRLMSSSSSLLGGKRRDREARVLSQDVSLTLGQPASAFPSIVPVGEAKVRSE